MSYHQYGGNPYGAPPGYGPYGNPPPGMGPPPGLGPPAGVPSAPGMAAPPGVQQPGTQHANRSAGLPSSFQPPINMPANINFSAPVIRLGTAAVTTGGRGDASAHPLGCSGLGCSGLGMDRGGEPTRDRIREAPQVIVPLSADERLRTMIIHHIPDGLGGDDGAHKICNAIGRLRRWEPSEGLWRDLNARLGLALFDDDESTAIALELLRYPGIQIPVKRQPATANPPPHDDAFEGIDKTLLRVEFDESAMEHHESMQKSRAEDGEFQSRLEAARLALKQVQRDLFYPPAGSRADGDASAAVGNNEVHANVEVVNIPIAQEDELSDVPAELRETVAREIAAFRKRSNQRDMERQRREEEIGVRHRQQNGQSAPSVGGANNVPLGPRSAGAVSSSAPAGPKGQNGTNRGVALTNGGAYDLDVLPNDEGEDTDASDKEIYRRKLKKKAEEEHKMFVEMERKWLNRERSRQLALDREQERERQEAEKRQRRKEEQRASEAAWDDNVEAARKTHAYYRDHAAWARKRAEERHEEEKRDEADRREEEAERRREEEAERRREQAMTERARGEADAFLEQQDREAEVGPAASAPAPQRFKLSLGAAAQRAQASRAMPQRRTIAEVEGLLDDEEAEVSVRRPLVPIQMDAGTGSGAMTEEEISQAARALAQEIPSDKDGLWGWDVKWDYMDESIVRERLRPFVEKKIVEHLGVQEEMLVETVEEHLRKNGTAGALVEELEGALDDEAEDLVKKLWRMVIFFTESEKRNLPA